MASRFSASSVAVHNGAGSGEEDSSSADDDGMMLTLPGHGATAARTDAGVAAEAPASAPQASEPPSRDAGTREAPDEGDAAGAIFCAVYPRVEQLCRELRELQQSQRQLIEAVRTQSLALSKRDELPRIHSTMARVPAYLKKLETIRSGARAADDEIRDLKEKSLTLWREVQAREGAGAETASVR
jgi:hypothetical protein